MDQLKIDKRTGTNQSAPYVNVCLNIFAFDCGMCSNLAPCSYRVLGGVYFGQLLGMSDHLSFTLGQNGYRAYKYVPYGPVHEVVPYLLRRAEENSSLLASDATRTERVLLVKELKRRLKLEKA